MAEQSRERPYLLDVSRLVWRVWRGKLPTGIDRVCQAYVEHFGARSQAVIQRRGFQFVLSPADSDRLFALLLSTETSKRLRLVKLAMTAWLAALSNKPRKGSIYLNVGHTGLDEESLPRWIARHSLRAIYLIHDLIPLTHPEFCRPGEAGKHARRMNNALDSAAGLIGNSQATLDDLQAFARERGRDVPPSVAAWLSGDFPADVEPKRVSRSHFITIGTIEGRKNHQLLLDVWRKLVSDRGDAAPLLLIVGQRGWQADRVFEQLDDLGELRDHVRELSACDDAELAGWIKGANALLMPSFAEGFGLPVFEALELGTPVIAADLPVYREVARDIPTYLRADDAEAWVRMVGDYTDNGAERQRQVADLEQFRAPVWDCHFQKVEAWLAGL